MKDEFYEPKYHYSHKENDIVTNEYREIKELTYCFEVSNISWITILKEYETTTECANDFYLYLGIVVDVLYRNYIYLDEDNIIISYLEKPSDVSNIKYVGEYYCILNKGSKWKSYKNFLISF